MNDIRKGKVITLDGEPYVVTAAEFLRKQQRRPVMRTTLKHLKTGRTREHSFQQADRIEEAAVTTRPGQFLYGGEGKFVFMDSETYEQFEVGADAVGEGARFLIEGQEAQVVWFEEMPLTVELPIKIERTVIETAPGVKGDTSSNVMKDATVEGGTRVRVPLFIKEGDRIRVDTRSGDYADRV